MRVDDLFGRIDTARQQLQQARDETEQTRQDPSEILREYQVKEDGKAPETFWGEAITETQYKLLNKLNPWDRLKVQNASTGAYLDAMLYYPKLNVFTKPDHVPDNVSHDDWVNNNGHRDAFRHAYWNALLVQEFGEQWTEQYTTAHEAFPDPPNPPSMEAMDLYNNEVGRQIVMENPDANRKELADLIFQAVERGDMVVVNSEGELARSNEVERWDHGIKENEEPVEGVMEVPDGEATPQ